jgi:hypothetical protein
MPDLSQLSYMDTYGRSLEESVNMLRDAYIRMRKDLEFYLSSLDEENISRITTDLLIAGKALISTALIEELIVGSNVVMGPNATISWSNVIGGASGALAAWVNSGYATHINAYGIYSGSFNGGMFNINPLSDPVLESGLTIGGWYGGVWRGEALRLQYNNSWGGFPATILSSVGGVDLVILLNVDFNNYVRFGSAIVTGLENSGYATRAWAAQKGASTGSDSHTHTVVVNGTTYTTSSNSHNHTQN